VYDAPRSLNPPIVRRTDIECDDPVENNNFDATFDELKEADAYVYSPMSDWSEDEFIEEGVDPISEKDIGYTNILPHSSCLNRTLYNVTLIYTLVLIMTLLPKWKNLNQK